MNKILFVIVCGVFLLCAAVGFSQPITINTFAGYAGSNGGDGVGGNARFNHPHGLAVDGAGNVYIADTDNHTIRKMTPSGAVSTIAGLAGVSGSDDDTGNKARFFRPQDVAVDSAGNLYVADTGNHTIRQVTPAGVVITVAGLAGVSGNASGNGSDARFNQPLGIGLDSSGTIYVADYGNGMIRKITPDLVVNPLVSLSGPQGVTVDSAGYIYVADYASSTILKVTSSGNLSTLAGSANNYGSINSNGTNAWFYYPAGVAVDSLGNVYVADYFNNTIRKITPAGAVSTLAGCAGNYGSNDATGTNALFYGPQGIAVDANFNVYVADTENSTIRKISPAGVVTTLAGSPSAGFANAMRGAARFDWPAGVAADNTGNLYVADAQNSIIRKITPIGAVSTLAGSGIYGSADGTGINAQFYGPQSIAVDSSGNVFVADTANHTIRKITPTGVTTTLAGSAGNNGSADGNGVNAEFYQPQGIATDNAGNLFVADTWNHTIRKITSAGVVSTLAGLAENPGSANGTNSNARFNWPMGMAVDSSGNLYVTDYFNHTIRKITQVGTNWVASTVAGMAGVSGNTDSTNSNARFFQPRGIVVDNANNLYVVDSGNHTIRMITPVETNWVVSTVAGWTGVSGSADGVGSNARFNSPAGITIDSMGYLYVADSANNTIRVDRIVPPLLQFSFAANQTVLSWSALTPGFILETTSTFSPTASWTPVNGWAISGDSYVLTNNMSAAAAFFRLRKP